MAVTEEEIRLLVWDKGDNAILKGEDIDIIIALSGGLLTRAVALGWAIIGGYYSQMIDITESGSQRRLSQLYKNAERQHEIWDKKAAVEEEVVGATVMRVPPLGFCILAGDSVDWADRVSMFRPNEPVNIRMFPLKRMPAIL